MKVYLKDRPAESFFDYAPPEVTETAAPEEPAEEPRAPKPPPDFTKQKYQETDLD